MAGALPTTTNQTSQTSLTPTIHSSHSIHACCSQQHHSFTTTYIHVSLYCILRALTFLWICSRNILELSLIPLLDVTRSAFAPATVCVRSMHNIHDSSTEDLFTD